VRCGVLALGGDLEWRGGIVEDGEGFGLLLFDGAVAVLQDVSVRDIGEGSWLQPYGWGVGVLRGALLVSHRVLIERTEIGLAHIGEPGGRSSFGSHEDLVVRECRERGIWVQDSVPLSPEAPSVAAVHLFGAATRIEENRGVSLGIVDSRGVAVDGGTIGNTSVRRMIPDGLQADFVDVGDGLHIVRSDDLLFRSLQIVNSERAGVLLDGSPVGAPRERPLNIAFAGVTVEGPDFGDRGFALQSAAIDGDAMPSVSPELAAKDAAAVERGDVLNPASRIRVSPTNGTEGEREP
jgi:hypothetical protein